VVNTSGVRKGALALAQVAQERLADLSAWRGFRPSKARKAANQTSADFVNGLPTFSLPTCLPLGGGFCQRSRQQAQPDRNIGSVTRPSGC
jgi:hypothetical protein